MGTAFELALVLDLQADLEREDIETLSYMTRSQNYDFQTSLNDDLFTECEEGFDQEWRIIIANTNNSDRAGEEFLSQTCRSVLRNNQLCFRILIDDGTYWNVWSEFSDWLLSVSTSEGVVGYLLDMTSFEADLIFFQSNGVITKSVESCKIPSSLMNRINNLLGGAGCLDG